MLETVWWLIPSGLIVVLALITWRGTHQYDPYKPIALKQDTMKVQVVAGESWWLFMYPGLGVASLNELMLPVNVPVKFDITADAPMNSFWIPQLGGQMYAMPGMVTRLHLVATEKGSYYGSSANISGKDFAKMNFQAKVTDQKQFDTWVDLARRSSCLNTDSYTDRNRQDLSHTVSANKLDPTLFDKIVQKYMSMDHEHSMIEPYEKDVVNCRG